MTGKSEDEKLEKRKMEEEKEEKEKKEEEEKLEEKEAEALTMMAIRGDAVSASVSEIEHSFANALHNIEIESEEETKTSGDEKDVIVVMNVALKLEGVTRDQFHQLKDEEKQVTLNKALAQAQNVSRNNDDDQNDSNEDNNDNNKDQNEDNNLDNDKEAVYDAEREMAQLNAAVDAATESESALKALDESPTAIFDANPDANIAANADANSNFDTNTDVNADANAGTNADANADANAGANADANADANAGAIAGTNADAKADANTGVKADGNSNYDTNPNAGADGTADAISSLDASDNAHVDFTAANEEAGTVSKDNVAEEMKKSGDKVEDEEIFGDKDDDEDTFGEKRHSAKSVATVLWDSTYDVLKNKISQQAQQAKAELGSLIGIENAVAEAAADDDADFPAVVAFPPLWIAGGAQIRRRHKPDANFAVKLQDWETEMPDRPTVYKLAITANRERMKRRCYTCLDHGLHTHCLGYTPCEPSAPVRRYDDVPTPLSPPSIGQGLVPRKKHQDEQQLIARNRHEPFKTKEILAKKEFRLGKSVPYYARKIKITGAGGGGGGVRAVKSNRIVAREIAKAVQQPKPPNSVEIKTRVDELSRPRATNACRNYFPREYLTAFQRPRDQRGFKEVELFLPKEQREAANRTVDSWPGAKAGAKRKERRKSLDM